MSVINKQPFIQKVIGSMTKSNLEDLQELLNGASETIFRSFINLDYPFTTDDKGVAHCVFEAKDKVFTGYLIYNNSYCVLVAYEGEKSQKMFSIKIDYANDKYEIVDEQLDINEFRRIVEDRSVNVKIDGNDVKANPTGEATGELSKVQIDGVVYSVLALPSGLDAEKTYTLKVVGGVLVAVEDEIAGE